MEARLSRSQFIRGDFSGRRRPIRPPWAIEEPDFLEQCTRCGDCIKACPQAILKPGSGAYPIVDFSQGECSFCHACAQQCPTTALLDHHNDELLAPWSLQMQIETHCLEHQGVVCAACGEHCEQSAIQFKPRIGGSKDVLIDSEQCNGCGACVTVCPRQAIKLTSFAE